MTLIGPLVTTISSPKVIGLVAKMVFVRLVQADWKASLTYPFVNKLTTKTPLLDGDFLTPAQLCAKFIWSESTYKRKAAKNQLPPFFVDNGERRFHKQLVEEWVAERMVYPVPLGSKQDLLVAPLGSEWDD